MNYTVLLKRSAEKELERLDSKTHDKIIKQLLALKENPLPKGVKNCKVGKDTECG